MAPSLSLLRAKRTFALRHAHLLIGSGLLAVLVAWLPHYLTRLPLSLHRRMVEFTSQLEHLIAMLILVLFAGAVASGLLDGLTWRDALLVAALLLAIRPVCAFISLLGAPHRLMSRATTAFFGIRGIGTLYGLMYALRAAQPSWKADWVGALVR